MLRKFTILLLFAFPMLMFGQTLRPKISVQSVEHDFGTNPGPFTFIIYNGGGGTLKIEKIRTTCSCVTTSLDKKEIEMADSAKLTVNYTGNPKTKNRIEYIYVTTNDENTPVLRLTAAFNKEVPPLIFPNLPSTDSINAKFRPLNSPEIYFPITSHDFGTVVQGNVVAFNFTVVNKGKSPLKIKRIRTSCGCTAAITDKNTLNPGDSTTIHTEFDSSAEEGKVHRSIEVLSNDPLNEKFILNIYAEVKPRTK
jgi:Protein of unknown function (DUF1573)